MSVDDDQDYPIILDSDDDRSDQSILESSAAAATSGMEIILQELRSLKDVVKEVEQKICKIEEMVLGHMTTASCQVSTFEVTLPLSSTPMATTLLETTHQGPSIPSTFTLTTPEKNWNAFSLEEDKLIVNFILKHGIEKNTGVNSGIWHQLKNKHFKDSGHTVQSLHGRFDKQIMKKEETLARCIPDPEKRKKFKSDMENSPTKKSSKKQKTSC